MPDFYQGTELWELNLVDPDNRRPVDFSKRREALEEITRRARMERASLVRELLENPGDGRLKLFTTCMALKARRENADLFYKGGYTPLEVRGEQKRHIIAFARQSGAEASITIAPRFLAALIKTGEYPFAGVWGDTEVVLPDTLRGGTFTDAFTAKEVAAYRKGLPVSEVFEGFPSALLLNTGRA